VAAGFPLVSKHSLFCSECKTCRCLSFHKRNSNDTRRTEGKGYVHNFSSRYELLSDPPIRERYNRKLKAVGPL